MADPLALHLNLVEVTKSLDDAAARSLIADDCVIYEEDDLPYGGVYRGPDGYVELCHKVWNAFGGANFELLYRLAEPGGNRMCTVNRLVGTSKSGTPVEALINEIWEFRDGKAVEARIWYFNATAVGKALRDG